MCDSIGGTMGYLNVKNQVITLLVLASSAALFLSSASSQDLEIHCVDVGQGSCELIIGPDGTTVLIDGGTSTMGRNRALPYLNDIFPPGDRALDYVICSHDHSDHYGGLNHILSNGYTAAAIYHSGNNSSFGRGQAIPVGLTIELGDGAVATCVLAYGNLADGSYVSPTSDKNTQSIGLLIEYGNFDYITAGDLTDRTEDDLAEMLVSYINPPNHPYHPSEPFLNTEDGVDVIHVNHHGSRYSSSTPYVNTLRCEIAVIPGGTSYGHPHRDAVDRLLARGTYTIDCSCSGGSSTCGKPTGVTAPGAEVYRTTEGSSDCRRSPEEDCPTAGDIVIISDGSSGYTVEGTYLDISYKEPDGNGADNDSDGDGLTDTEEAALRTNPHNADSDDDGYCDLIEVSCGSASMALDQNLHPARIKVNFQDRNTDRPGSYSPADSADYSSALGYGWQ